MPAALNVWQRVGVGQPCNLHTSFDHQKDIEPAHCVDGQVVAFVHRPKQRLLLFRRYPRHLDPVIQVDFQAGMAGHSRCSSPASDETKDATKFS